MPLGVRIDANTEGIAVGLTELQTRAASLKAVRKGIKVVNSAVKPSAPKKLGHLRKAQGVKAVKGKKTKTGSFGVQGAKTRYFRSVAAGSRARSANRIIRPSKYDHLVIGGARPHVIRKGSKLARTFKSGKFQPSVGQGTGKPHPGARANPYRRRAYETVRGSVTAAVVNTMAAEVNKILAKMHAKTMQKLSGN